MVIKKLDDLTEEQKGQIEVAALSSIIKGMKEDPYLALTYLQSTRPDKFHQVTNTDSLVTMLEQAGLEIIHKKEIEDLLD